MMKRTASAVWSGNLQQGKGSLTTQSGVFKETPYSFRSRFGDGTETNPEELIAAAHAGCFTMALSLFLQNAGFTADRLTTTATVTLEQVGAGFSITAVQLELKGKVPGLDQAKFEAIANEAKVNCPVSKVLNAPITLKVTLET
jgi:osmotically inducible protein OsmC